MNKTLRSDADTIIREAIEAVLPDAALQRALTDHPIEGSVTLIAVGKAAYEMAASASHLLGDQIADGIVVTKYGYAGEPLPNLEIFEAGHPVPDENSYLAAEAVLEKTKDLDPSDQILFLVSGGASALFEDTKIPKEELAEITSQMLACGADICEINTIRKRLSNVKGGKFAKHCEPAKIFQVVLSDVLGDPLDMIASGPAVADTSTCEEAIEIAKKYDLKLSDQAWACLSEETPKEIDNVTTEIAGNVRGLIDSAAKTCERLGYTPIYLTDRLDCEASEAGRFMADIALSHQDTDHSIAFLVGGESVVHLSGHGKGGRNQQAALAAAQDLDGLPQTAIFSIGSDGTDGPTDAAGGYVDGESLEAMRKLGIDLFRVLQEDNAYPNLDAIGGLVKTGPTGTNVNDLMVLLIKRDPD